MAELDKEIKQKLEEHFNIIGSMGYYCPEVKAFHQEILNKLESNSFKEIEDWLRGSAAPFLSEAHPGKVYAVTGTLIILPLSDKLANIITSEILKMLKNELAKINKNPYYQYDRRGIDLRLGCLQFFSARQGRLTGSNKTTFLKLANSIKITSNELGFIKQIFSEIITEKNFQAGKKTKKKE